MDQITYNGQWYRKPLGTYTTGPPYISDWNDDVLFHLKELLLEHAPPPPAIAEYAIANLIKMGFPQRAAEGVISICVCHKEAKVGAGYTCPRCKARVCELPTECRLCGLTLVSSPHLARSYHHLFPITPFDEVSFSSGDVIERKSLESCFGCMQKLINSGERSCDFEFIAFRIGTAMDSGLERDPF